MIVKRRELIKSDPEAA
jgi:cytochrome P450